MKSELRQDLVTGDWIVVVPGRFSGHVAIQKEPRQPSPIDSCPFEEPEKTGTGKPPSVRYGKGKDWTLQIVQNLHPAVQEEGLQFVMAHHGPYRVLPGVGTHDILITREHDMNLPDLPEERSRDIFRAYQERYRQLSKEEHLAYVAIFNNWGKRAGATIYHPHSQIISLPIVPTDVRHSLQGSAAYYEKHKTCVHCAILEFEYKEKKRIIYENDCAVAFTPYISKSPYEIRVFPKMHLPYFEDADEGMLLCVADAVKASLKMLRATLHDPDYNFFIHTAPLREKSAFAHYHWHLEIIPRVKINAGFEFGTGIDVNFVDPHEAAEYLRGEKKY